MMMCTAFFLYHVPLLVYNLVMRMLFAEFFKYFKPMEVGDKHFCKDKMFRQCLFHMCGIVLLYVLFLHHCYTFIM